MKKHIKLFEEITTPLEEAGGKKKGAAIEAKRPHTNGNYALATAKDFHIRELIGELDEELEQNFGNNEEAKQQAKQQIFDSWIQELTDWVNNNY